MYSNYNGHMTKITATPIYGKNYCKRWWVTIIYFETRSTYIAYASEFGKLLKYYLKGKFAKKMANGQTIHDSEKYPGVYLPRHLSYVYGHNITACVLTILYTCTCIFPGERLHDR